MILSTLTRLKNRKKKLLINCFVFILVFFKMTFLGNLLGFGRKLGGSLARSVGQTLGMPLKIANKAINWGDSLIGKDNLNALPGVAQARAATGKGNIAVKLGDGIAGLIDPKKTGRGYNLADPRFSARFAHDITGQPRPFLLR